ncbi:lysophospholipid acyltransferase family protein [Parvularcula lutaonensis]|uniref:Lysophospholipid acyltransferase family protein n=1 Tax=Parvularcula lutaonensis TaxID=491923 RepID=A0ABV7MBS0_9PROT|nr:lysophospholipid acyltransferase family protein [Parvularcula lutaonensis]GGY45095.1 1-acyl-sn-glycerol-3-phosphate acyltransferase [Parvularcula lutaonensis]
MTRLRSILFVLLMFLFAIVTGLVAWPALFKREWSLAVSKFWTRGTLWLLKVLCGIRDEVRGMEHLPTGPAIIAAKHQSMWETLKLTTILPRPCFVLKKELKGWPIFSWFAIANGFIFIDREAGAKSLRDMTNQAKERLAEGAQIVIFPEGTRSAPGERLPYQPGVAALAKALDVPTVPVSHNSGEYWLQPGPIKKPGTIIMTIHPPITDVSNRKQFLRAVEAAIEGEEETAA